MKLVWLLIALPVAGWAQSSKELKVKGVLTTAKTVDTVVISYRSGDDLVSDTISVKNGEFKYKGVIKEPVLGSIIFKSPDVLVQNSRSGLKAYGMPVFFEPGTIDIVSKDSVQATQVSGSKAHADYEALQKAKKAYDIQLNGLYADYNAASQAKDKAAMDAIELRINTLDSTIRETVYLPFVKSRSASPVALYAVKQYAGYEINADKVDPVYALLPASIKAYPSAIAFKELVDIARKTGIGKTAMDFTQADTLGNPVSLSSFKGKYVLVDFWASWCGPCRRENPNVVKVFDKYKDRNFTILSVSLDRPNAKDKWLKAIHDDKLDWTHVSDLKYWDNAVAKQYGVRAIPGNLLLDPSGKIIAKNLRGEDLERELAKVIGN
jgi:peroxiredoxin